MEELRIRSGNWSCLKHFSLGVFTPLTIQVCHHLCQRHPGRWERDEGTERASTALWLQCGRKMVKLNHHRGYSQRLEMWPLIHTPLKTKTRPPGCSTTLLLTSLVLSEGGQDTHSSFEAATGVLECAFSFPRPLKHTALDQYTHCCSYEINQIKKFSQVTTSHLFLTWSSLCIDTGTGFTLQPRQKGNAG